MPLSSSKRGLLFLHAAFFVLSPRTTLFVQSPLCMLTSSLSVPWSRRPFLYTLQTHMPPNSVLLLPCAISNRHATSYRFIFPSRSLVWLDPDDTKKLRDLFLLRRGSTQSETTWLSLTSIRCLTTRHRASTLHLLGRSTTFQLAPILLCLALNRKRWL